MSIMGLGHNYVYSVRFGAGPINFVPAELSVVSVVPSSTTDVYL